MPRLLRHPLTAALVSALTSGAAVAQFSDNFDSYLNGAQLQGVNGWKGWDNAAAAAGAVTNTFSLSAPNAIAINPTTDAVNELGNPTSGCWRFSTRTYVPSGLTGDQYLILLNTYADGGPNSWSVELKLSGATGRISDDFDAAWAGAPIPFDCWFGFQIDIDLDNDLCATRIDLNCDGVFDDDGADNLAGTADDELISSGQSWANRGTGGGAAAIGAVDLYSAGASTIYHDDVSLAPCPMPAFVATSYCGPAVPNSTGGSASISASGALSPGAVDLRFHATGIPMNSFGVFSMGTAADNVPMAGGSTGTLCLGGTVERGVGLQVLFSGASNSVSVAAQVGFMTPAGTAVVPGDTRYFQYWFRDVGSTSNFTDGLMVTFQ